MRRPSKQLQSWIQQQIDHLAGGEEPGNWPRQVMREHQVLLVEGDNLMLWFLSPQGELFSLDTDRFGRRLEPERNPAELRRVLEAAARTFPPLGELLEPE